MDSKSTYENSIDSGISKILEGNALIEAEQQKMLAITLSTQEYLQANNITEPTLRKRRNTKLIPFIKIGKEYRYFSTTKGGVNNG